MTTEKIEELKKCWDSSVEKIVWKIKLLDNDKEKKEDMAILWERVERFVRYVLRQKVGADNEDFEDYVQQCVIELYPAVLSYNGSATFLTFYTYAIKKAIRYYSTKCGGISITSEMRAKIRLYLDFVEDYQRENGKHPTDAQIAEGLRMTKLTIRNIQKAVGKANLASLDQYISEEDDTTIKDMIPSDEDIEEAVCGSIYQNELHEALDEALSLLDESTQKLIRYSYYRCGSYGQAAFNLKITPQAVHDRCGRGFMKILENQKAKLNLMGFLIGNEKQLDELMIYGEKEHKEYPENAEFSEFII